jgi:primary-amine oxidase
VVDANSKQVLHIDFPPQYKESSSAGLRLSTSSTEPPAVNLDALVASNRGRLPPPQKAFDFLPELMIKTENNFKPREGLKPLHVVQPEGVSFKMNGHELEWQNWKMHIGELSGAQFFA